jgi:hypothetical protein
VKELLSRGANPERVDGGGKTAWYWFVCFCSLFVRILLRFRANVLHFEEIKAMLPEQKYNWLKYQELISPPPPKPKEDPKKKKKGKKGKKR